MNIRSIMFDFDLTLADSSSGIVECTRYALDRLGYEAAPGARIHATIGLPLQQMFRLLTGDERPEPAAQFASRFVERADEVMVSSTRIYPEVPDLLSRLRERGLDIAIVSSKFRYRIEAILAAAGLQSQVDVIVGGEDVQRHKPHPDALVLALERLRSDALSAIYVGDHAVDAEAARSAGVRFIGVVSGTTSHAEWSRMGVTGRRYGANAGSA
jgi:phosphoglycolate phosphatase